MSSPTSTSNTNLLAVKNVTASGYESGTTNYPKNTIDNNYTTRWSNPIPSWITFDLGSQFYIADVKIAWYNGNQRKMTFSISISSDNTNFTNVYSGQSSGTTTALETYSFNTSQAAGSRYVKVTVTANTENNWASITEVKIDGSTSSPTPTPIPTPPTTTNIDVNGVTMLYPTDFTKPAFFYKMGDNITSGKYIRTDSNSATQMTQNNIIFQRITANNVSYSTGTGKTVRVNVNAGGFISSQAHTWKDSNVQYIWTPSDSKNCEFTYYFRVVNYVQSHTECASKLRGGIHTGSNDPRASCFQTNFFIGGGSTATESALEYNHPSYHFSSITPLIPNTAKAGIWIGRKTIVWNGKDGKVHTEDWIDFNPFTSTGAPANNWKKFFTQTFVGDSTYNKVPLWGGMMTFRQDGYEYVDVAIISVREIVPPS